MRKRNWPTSLGISMYACVSICVINGKVMYIHNIYLLPIYTYILYYVCISLPEFGLELPRWYVCGVLGQLHHNSQSQWSQQHLRIVGQCRYASLLLFSLLLLLLWLVVFNAWYVGVNTRVVCANEIQNLHSTACYRICHSWAVLTTSYCCCCCCLSVTYNNTCLLCEYECSCCCFIFIYFYIFVCCCVIYLLAYLKS